MAFEVSWNSLQGLYAGVHQAAVRPEENQQSQKYDADFT